MIGITATPLPHSAVVHYDVSSVEMEAQQPETTPIAHFESTPSENVGTLLDVNANYVVYAVKNGLVRVLDRRSTLRTLLRGHTEKVTDVEFFQNGDVLGTVGGNVIIWRIFSREDSSELTAEKLLEIPSDAHNLPNVSRLIWHPFNPNQFWLIHDDVDNADDTTPLTSGRSAIATLVETTRITTNAHGNGEPHAVCQFFSPGVVMDGALQLACEGVLDLCWSGRDARHVLTTHKDGCIRLWDVKQLNEKVSNHVKNKVGGDVIDTTHLNIAKCVATIVGQQGDGPVTRCFFLPHDDTDSENRSNNLTSPFVTATHRNSCVTLWSPFKEDGSSPPTKLAVFWVKDSNNDLGYNLSPCFGGIPVGNAPPASFLLFSDRSHGNIYALALKSKWSSSEGNAGPKRAILDGWDYIVPFECMHPVYSWSLTCAPAQTLDEDGGDGGDGNSQGPLIDMHLYSVQSRVVQLLTLTHAMCVPPPACTTWQGISDQYLEYGIRIESIESSNLAAAPAADEFEEDDYELEGDELGDAEFEDYDDDDQEEEEDPHNHNGAAPNAPATDTSNDQGNPFPNWLGAIIGNKSAASPDAKEIPSLPPPPPPPPPPPTVISTPAPPAPGLDLESSPLPPGMATIATATSGTTIAASSNIINTSNNSKSSRLGSAFLSPIELLSSSTSGTNLDKAAGALPKLSETVNLIEIQQQQQQQKNKTQKKKSPRSRSPIPKGKKNNKSGKNNNNMPSMPVPSADGKIAILKRDGAAPQLPSAPIPDRQSPPSLDNAALGVPPIVARGDMEDVLKRIIAAQFKKHEQIVSTEIQRAVRSEVQNTVLPTLSKTIAQTMEQSVVKPLQLAFKQSSKESTKVRTAEVIEAVSGSVEEPLKDAFSQSMQTVMIPAYESATREMFSQISSSLDQGLASNRSDDSAKLLVEMASQLNAMSKSIQALSAEVTQLKATTPVVAAPLPSLRPGVVAAKQVPPPPQQDETQKVKDEILFLLKTRSYEAAFTKALSASTANMAGFCCRNANIVDIFSLPGSASTTSSSQPLSQPILLCLMQQLGAVLMSSGDDNLMVELQWLQEIALTLDTKNVNIERHVPAVLQQLMASINDKTGQGDPQLRRPLQMLAQVIRGMQ